MTKTMDVVRSEFIEKTGLIAQNQDIPRVAGRVLGLLIFDGQAASFGDLARELQVSRGSISTSTRFLEDRGLIKRVTKPGERQDFFQLAACPFSSMLLRLEQELIRAHTDIQATVAEICSSRPDIKARVQNYGDLYAALSASIKKTAETL